MIVPHIPVLANEILEIFKNINGTILDCTLGYAGHSSLILKHNPNAKIIACDRDDEAIAFSQKRLEIFKDRINIHKMKFSELPSFAKGEKIAGILADIGVSSLQLDKNDRGFSTKSTELDMRMDKTQNLDAKFVVNNYSRDELVRVLKDYGELNNAEIYADKIIKFRTNKNFTNALELAQIFGVSGYKGRSVGTATLGFQAIRIEVNNELGELKNLLTNIKNLAPKGGILAIISFHSLEDRIIKNTFKEWEKNCICPDFALKCECGNNHALGKIINKKPITASEDELKANSRASCAKLRVFKFKD